MTEHTAQYDHIGSKYDEYARTATLKRAECYTFFHLVGGLSGKRVLDLACGFGYDTRQLKQRGAAQVVGVDISPTMVSLARAKGHEEPAGVEYLVHDAAHLPRLGYFDLVTAVYLLNYATNEVNPQRWQTCCEPGAIGIDEFSHKQFRANSKDFCFHKLSPCWKGSVADSHCERI
jgi:ubiquinone/menaquinone biosynthesis C-methylase UbiE